MAMIALVSAGGSDGVTTSATALALQSSRPVLLAELDMSGGRLRHRLLADIERAPGERLTREIGLHKLPQANWERAGEESDFTPYVSQHLWPMDDSDYRVVLPGLTDPRQAASLTSVWPTLLNVLRLTDQNLKWDVLVDGGRMVVEAGGLHPVLTPAPVLHQADLVLLVVRDTPESQAFAYSMAKVLQAELEKHGSGTRGLGVLLLGDRFHRDEVGHYLEIPVLGQLPWDEAGASYVMRGGKMPRGVSRSRLMRSAHDLMGPLREHADRRQLHRQMRTQATSPAAARLMQQLQQGVRHG
ncbi:hypothetical protein RCO28_34355 [Streptomyces sp. LHD-70]|uniref:MinD/ParA family ATP-binding protein n=1 Tax=Streptomyces sp. LHD-70 TaxID=3072140 RepID=UPI00280D5D47|nr:hypothetical protein [Streptomyces sp. LHD-70]MDQ8707515.1 hypothetical protein [Streptomyces sp. LHD-70]